MPLVIGIDIGGTKIAGGIVDSCGTILAKYTCPSYGFLGREITLVTRASSTDSSTAGFSTETFSQ